jgi:hypothetical protein
MMIGVAGQNHATAKASTFGLGEMPVLAACYFYLALNESAKFGHIEMFPHFWLNRACHTNIRIFTINI